MTPTCPLCAAPVPERVLNGPPKTVFTCEVCAEVLTWSRGRAISSRAAISRAKAQHGELLKGVDQVLNKPAPALAPASVEHVQRPPGVAPMAPVRLGAPREVPPPPRPFAVPAPPTRLPGSPMPAESAPRAPLFGAPLPPAAVAVPTIAPLRSIDSEPFGIPPAPQSGSGARHPPAVARQSPAPVSAPAREKPLPTGVDTLAVARQPPTQVSAPVREKPPSTAVAAPAVARREPAELAAPALGTPAPTEVVAATGGRSSPTDPIGPSLGRTSATDPIVPSLATSELAGGSAPSSSAAPRIPTAEVELSPPADSDQAVAPSNAVTAPIAAAAATTRSRFPVGPVAFVVMMALAGGGWALFGRHSSSRIQGVDSKGPVEPAAAVAPDPAPRPAPPSVPTMAVPPVPSPPAGPAPAAVPPEPPPDEPKVTRLGGKKVVLEYDKPGSPAPTPAAPVPDTGGDVQKARSIYQQGNARLFNGDAKGAEQAYLEALRVYPGYVAGYRGLGFAYEQEGDASKALTAFRLYVKTVPTARDVPLIKKRIDKLQRGGQ